MNVFRRPKWFVLSAIATILISIVACGSPARTTPVADAGSGTTAQQIAPAGQAAAVLGTLEIHSVDMGFKPATLTVDQPGRYTIKLINDGVIPHDITFADGSKAVANAGETKTRRWMSIFRRRD